VTTLVVEGLRARVAGREVLTGVDLEVSSGQVHAVMGPNGSGKTTLAHVLMGHPGYEVLGGRVLLDGTDLLSLPTWERARAGLFLAWQDPVEVPGVTVTQALAEAFAGAGRDASHVGRDLEAHAAAVGFDRRVLERPLNVGLSGGERKRNETVQLAVLRPRIAVLDELDSGLDIDALRLVARHLVAATRDEGLGVLAITHYRRLLDELRPEAVHVLSGGRIAASGGPELAVELEKTGYGGWA
jgi:Fe-S cluster assembly ATP-binding protein